MSYSFIGKIFKQHGHPYVDVPLQLGQALSEAGGKEGFLPVQAEVYGLKYVASLTPRGDGTFRLFLTDEMRKRKGFKVGMAINVTLELAAAPEAAALPTDLAAALQAQPTAHAAFSAQPAQRQRELVRWLEQTREAELRAKALTHILTYLTTGQLP